MRAPLFGYFGGSLSSNSPPRMALDGRAKRTTIPKAAAVNEKCIIMVRKCDFVKRTKKSEPKNENVKRNEESGISRCPDKTRVIWNDPSFFGQNDRRTFSHDVEHQKGQMTSQLHSRRQNTTAGDDENLRRP
jgi:hypothetical protein